MKEETSLNFYSFLKFFNAFFLTNNKELEVNFSVIFLSCFELQMSTCPAHPPPQTIKTPHIILRYIPLGVKKRIMTTIHDI